MTDPAGVVAFLTGSALLVLSSTGLAATCRFKGFASNILAIVIIGYATIVLLAQILSELGSIGRSGFLIGQALITGFVLVLVINLFQASFVPEVKIWISLVRQHRWRQQSPALSLLGVSIGLMLLLSGYLIFVVPPNNYDSFWYHLSRVAHWLHNGTLHHFQTADLIKT